MATAKKTTATKTAKKTTTAKPATKTAKKTTTKAVAKPATSSVSELTVSGNKKLELFKKSLIKSFHTCDLAYITVMPDSK